MRTMLRVLLVSPACRNKKRLTCHSLDQPHPVGPTERRPANYPQRQSYMRAIYLKVVSCRNQESHECSQVQMLGDSQPASAQWGSLKIKHKTQDTCSLHVQQQAEQL